MRTFRTLFSGGELFGIGARAAGWQHIDGYEINSKIAAVARRNGFDVRVADVCGVDYASLPAADHLHGSPSCKNASQANIDGGEAAEDLACADAICRAITAHQGATFTLENVWQYRTFESFDRILESLRQSGFSFDYWHLNSADYGVPQTRKRLILTARRGVCRIQRPHPTHRQGGDMFHPPWVGWYAAIEDLIDTLPPTQPAPWQLARMPEELRTMLVGDQAAAHGEGVQTAGADDHRRVVRASTHAPRAFLLRGENTQQEWGKGYRDGDGSSPSLSTGASAKAYIVEGTGAGDDRLVTVRHSDEPMWTLRAQGRMDAARAYLVGGGNTGFEKVASHARTDEVPAFTDREGGHGSPERALLLDGQTGAYGTNMTHREGWPPSFTMRANSNERQVVRAYVGRWVRMTVQALGRFQTVPDDYIGLTAQINGNGVPCLLAQRIMESL